MRVTIWGVRGSIPSPGPATVRYGGNTPCLEVRPAAGDGLLVLDAGTGIRALGDVLENAGGNVSADIAITHAHWDHVQGLPFFGPLYKPDSSLRIWGAGAASPEVLHSVRAQMTPGTFPVAFEELPSDIRLGELPERTTLSHFTIQHFAASHRGGAVAFRVVEGNGEGPALVYLPDNELGAPERHGLDQGWRKRLLGFLNGTSLLVHDAMYTEAEYARHQGWGHSHVDEVVRLAGEAGVRRLVLFHHHPSRSDDELDRSLERCRRAAEAQGIQQVMGATEGVTLEV